MSKTKVNLEPIEKQLWQTADKLRRNIDEAEYKYIVLGLIFLKYISDDISKIADNYHNWQKEDNSYQDIKGFCKSVLVKKEEVAEKDYVLTLGRYVGLEKTEDDFDFVENFTKLQNELKEQMAQEAKLNERILVNLEKININTN